jgi:uncharacterized membrane protein YbhN (UPF0104 family)
VLLIPDTHFYPTILGAVLLGIGIALLIDVYGQPHGLAITGAIAINFCGAGFLILWLIFAPLGLPLRGYIVLWAIAIVVPAIGFVELIRKSWKEKRAHTLKHNLSFGRCF